MRLEFPSHVLEIFSSIKFRWSSSNRTRGQTDRRADMMKLIVTCRYFGNAPYKHICSLIKHGKLRWWGTPFLLPSIPLSQLKTVFCFLLLLLFPVPRMMTVTGKYEGGKKIRTVWAVSCRPERTGTVRHL